MTQNQTLQVKHADQAKMSKSDINLLALKLIEKHSRLLAGEILDDLTNTLQPSPILHTSSISEKQISRYKLLADMHIMKSKKAGASGDAYEMIFQLECANFYRALEMGFVKENENKIERWK